MKSTIIKKSNYDEQLNQITITINIIYIQNFVQFFEKKSY